MLTNKDGWNVHPDVEIFKNNDGWNIPRHWNEKIQQRLLWVPDIEMDPNNDGFFDKVCRSIVLYNDYS